MRIGRWLVVGGWWLVVKRNKQPATSTDKRINPAISEKLKPAYEILDKSAVSNFAVAAGFVAKSGVYRQMIVTASAHLVVA